jgi:hypothetical protein
MTVRYATLAPPLATAVSAALRARAAIVDTKRARSWAEKGKEIGEGTRQASHFGRYGTPSRLTLTTANRPTPSAEITVRMPKGATHAPLRPCARFFGDGSLGETLSDLTDS